MEKIKKIGIVVKPHAPELKEKLEKIILLFKKEEFEVFLDEKAPIRGQFKILKREEIPEKCDLVVVMGGDGTFLSVAHLTAIHNKYIVGINLGNLGFLTEFTFEEFFEFVKKIKANEFDYSSRLLITTTFKAKEYHALNDIVISKGNIARMLNLEVFVENKFFSKVRADGMIIATPTGSTAYNLSSGGPIITPNSKNIIITPICPHSLTLKPVIVSSNCKIKVNILKGDSAFLTVDGQRGENINSGDSIEIKTSKHSLKIINNPLRDYFSILREKLKWG